MLKHISCQIVMLDAAGPEIPQLLPVPCLEFELYEFSAVKNEVVFCYTDHDMFSNFNV